MRIQLYKNKAKVKDEDPDFIAKQKQRTGADDGSPSYETVIVGAAWKMEGPDEVYLEVKIEGFNNNKPK